VAEAKPRAAMPRMDFRMEGDVMVVTMDFTESIMRAVTSQAAEMARSLGLKPGEVRVRRLSEARFELYIPVRAAVERRLEEQPEEWVRVE